MTEHGAQRQQSTMTKYRINGEKSVTELAESATYRPVRGQSLIRRRRAKSMTTWKPRVTMSAMLPKKAQYTTDRAKSSAVLTPDRQEGSNRLNPYTH